MASDGRAARYVAIITDGNGRWAQQRGLPVIEGHQAGADVVKARLRVMDLTALTLCMENDLPIHVFNMDDEHNIDRIVSGERVGTLVAT